MTEGMEDFEAGASARAGQAIASPAVAPVEPTDGVCCGPAAPAPASVSPPVTETDGGDSLIEQRLRRLAGIRQPTLEQLEEKEFLTEYVKWRNRGVAGKREDGKTGNTLKK